MSSILGQSRTWILTGRRLELSIAAFGILWLLLVGVGLGRSVPLDTAAFWIVIGFSAILPLSGLAVIALLKPRLRSSIGIEAPHPSGKPKLESRLARYFLVLVVCMTVAFRAVGFALQRQASPMLVLRFLLLPIAAVGLYIAVSEIRLRRSRAGRETAVASSEGAQIGGLPKFSYRLAFYLFLLVGGVDLISDLEKYARERNESARWLVYFFLAGMAIAAIIIGRNEVKMWRKTKPDEQDVDAH